MGVNVNANSSGASGRGQTVILALLAFAAVALVLRMRGPSSGGASEAAVGAPLPDLTRVAGWLNVPEGTDSASVAADLQSERLLVVDCWATWCGPCVRLLPHLAETVRAYGPQGVKFVGLTSEGAEEVDAIQRVIGKTAGFTWPVGYGADDFMDRMGINAIPTVILFRGNRVVWSSVGGHGLTEALDEQLAATQPPPR